MCAAHISQLYLEELAECCMRKGLVGSISAALVEGGLHELLHLSTEGPLRTSVDNKLTRMCLV